MRWPLATTLAPPHTVAISRSRCVCSKLFPLRFDKLKIGTREDDDADDVKMEAIRSRAMWERACRGCVNFPERDLEAVRLTTTETHAHAHTHTRLLYCPLLCGGPQNDKPVRAFDGRKGVPFFLFACTPIFTVKFFSLIISAFVAAFLFPSPQHNRSPRTTHRSQARERACKIASPAFTPSPPLHKSLARARRRGKVHPIASASHPSTRTGRGVGWRCEGVGEREGKKSFFFFFFFVVFLQ